MIYAREMKINKNTVGKVVHMCLSFCIVQGVFTRRLVFVQLFVCHAAI